MRDTQRWIASVGALLVLGLASSASVEAAEGTPTFAKDVAPILFDKCVSCHRPNHLAPMSLMSYDDARPWARAVKQKVSNREMPPWGAAPGIQRYANDPSLSQAEIDTIVAWADGGAPYGNDADLPPVPQFTEGWSIGEPDLVFTMLEPFEVPADGTIPYLYVTVPMNLKDDIWVSATEFRPENRRVVHHVIADVVEGNGQPPDPSLKLQRDPSRTEVEGATVGGYVPNRLGTVFPKGTASRIPAGADIEAQMHYTTIGTPTTDRSSWGVVLAPEAPSAIRQTRGGRIANRTFVIPSGHPNYEVRGTSDVERDTYLLSMGTHMHVRGKDATYTVIYPDGRREVVLDVPRYDFNWQLRYELAEPLFMPKGSTVEVVAHYDNSENNRFNPDPTAEVRWGPQTWEEMMLFGYRTVDAPGPTRSTEEQQ